MTIFTSQFSVLRGARLLITAAQETSKSLQTLPFANELKTPLLARVFTEKMTGPAASCGVQHPAHSREPAERDANRAGGSGIYRLWPTLRGLWVDPQSMVLMVGKGGQRVVAHE